MDILDIMMAKKLSGGGGSDPIVENAKTTGGIGWTESGEQTVIEWDGNTEGRSEIQAMMSPDYIFPSGFFKISDSIPTIDDIVGGKLIFMGSEQIIADSDIIEMGGMVGIGNSTVGGTLIIISLAGTYYNQGSGFVVPEDGVYAINAGSGNMFVSYFEFGNNHVHKINEKYLPGGGGSNSDYIINCTCSYVEEEGLEPYNEVTMSNDPQEIVEAINQNKNIVVKLEDTEWPLISTSRRVQCDKWVETWYDDDDEPVNAVVYFVTAKFSEVGVYEEASVLDISISEYEGEEYELDSLLLRMDGDFVHWRWDEGTFEDHIDQKIISAIGNAIGGEY